MRHLGGGSGLGRPGLLDEDRGGAVWRGCRIV
jgi:hypothetical protein